MAVESVESENSAAIAEEKSEYQVFARKYRPTLFEDLIGQEVLVETLSNAIATGRIAHAFLFTGIRGVGKTTTARLMARALNCVGEDGKGQATASPCGRCDQCTAIAEDRHPDVLEMDAASRTGVGDIREIIENVKYKPSMARYKIYIIDEVHMLSNSAFNALLKTLEEPPAHIIFIFATTEIRKIPVTILSRCQRFDLKRIDQELMVQHLSSIAAKENIQAEPRALELVAAASEGSVRDALSLLDQAVAYSSLSDKKEEGGVPVITESLTRKMLGVIDKTAIYQLFEQMVQGKVEDALLHYRAMYQDGMDPQLVIEDLMELVHLVMRLKCAPSLLKSALLTEVERVKGALFAEKLSIPYLSRAWQLLQKTAADLRHAASSYMAVEVALIHLAYVSELPTIDVLLKNPSRIPVVSAAVAAASAAPASEPQKAQDISQPAPAPALALEPKPELQSESETQSESQSVPEAISSFEQLVALFKAHDEPLLYHLIKEHMKVAAFEPGKVLCAPSESLDANTVRRIQNCLKNWTNVAWVIEIAHDTQAESINEAEARKGEELKATLAAQPEIKAVLEQFPGATVQAVLDMPAKNEPAPSEEISRKTEIIQEDSEQEEAGLLDLLEPTS